MSTESLEDFTNAAVEMKFKFTPTFPGETFEERIGAAIQQAAKVEKDKHAVLLEALGDIAVLRQADLTPVQIKVLDTIETEVLKLKMRPGG